MACNNCLNALDSFLSSIGETVDSYIEPCSPESIGYKLPNHSCSDTDNCMCSCKEIIFEIPDFVPPETPANHAEIHAAKPKE
mgnify:FL=1|tara:strand:+ start:842 stop:1087 length:246 start_codon:yes stop_codon:yes gene_type:complete